jgi:nitrogen fixation protein FixH
MIRFKATKDIKKGEWPIDVYAKDLDEMSYNEEAGVEIEK